MNLPEKVELCEIGICIFVWLEFSARRHISSISFDVTMSTFSNVSTRKSEFDQFR
jgi:hypothetical protein